MIVDKTKKIHEQITPESWCQGDMFLYDADGNLVACCLLGWLSWTSTNLMPFKKLCLALGFNKISQFNDNSTFETVLAVLKKADV